MTTEQNDYVETKDKEILALEELIRKPEQREALFSQAKRFAIELDEHARRGKTINADIKAVAEETFGIKAGTFKTFIGDVYNLDRQIELLTAQIDVLEALKEEKAKKEVGQVPEGYEE